MDSNKTDFYKLALLGHPLSHSRSPEMHKRALKHFDLEGEYTLIDVPESELAATVQRLKDEGYAGFNVTVPYKEKIIPLLDTVPGPPLKLGAVNTVVIDKSTGCATGYNTDITGITLTILDHFKEPGFSKLGAIVLGSGGAARACVYALKLLECKNICILARNEEKARQIVQEMQSIPEDRNQSPEQKHLTQSTLHYVLCTKHNVHNALCETQNAKHNVHNTKRFAQSAMHNALSVFAGEGPNLFVNATPLGQASKEPVEPGFFEDLVAQLPEHCFVFDMVYASNDQKMTPLVEAAKKRGLKAQDGTFMLATQALEAFKIWTGRTVSTETMLGREPNL